MSIFPIEIDRNQEKLGIFALIIPAFWSQREVDSAFTGEGTQKLHSLLSDVKLMESRSGTHPREFINLPFVISTFPGEAISPGNYIPLKLCRGEIMKWVLEYKDISLSLSWPPKQEGDT